MVRDARRALRARDLATAALVAGLAVLAYLPALGAGFAGDDFLMLRTAGAVNGPAWAFVHNDLGQAAGSGHFYRPLWVLFNAGILRVFGARAPAFHAANLLLFATIALQTWALARRLAGPGAALVAGVAFALYPRHGESVAWVSGSTDLLAAALMMAAILCALTSRPGGPRLVACALLAAGATLAKEAAVVAPALVLLAWWARPDRPRRERRWWAAPAAMLAGTIVVLAGRAVVIGGLGGYGGHAVTARRVAGSLASYLLAAGSPPQLELLRAPVLLAVPAIVALLLALGLARLHWRGERERMRVALAGLAWFAVGLVPVLNLPLDLNTANGERLLLIPSVGLALAVGAIVADPRSALRPARPSADGRRRGTALSAARPRGRARTGALVPTALVALAAAAGAACVLDAREWTTAGRLAGRVTDAAARMGPGGGELVILDVPEDYRSAHVFPDSLDVAVARAGRPDLLVTTCAAVHVRSLGAGAVSFTRTGRGGFAGRTTAAAPFDFPVFASGVQGSAACPYARLGARGNQPLGTGLAALVAPAPVRSKVLYAVFDGQALRALRLNAPAP